MRRRWVEVASVLVGAVVQLSALAACTSPGYEPELVRHGLPLPEAAFERVVEVVQERYRRILLADPEEFRIETDWHPFQPGDLPGQRRAFVFRKDGYLRVVVEHFFDRMGAFGPERTATTGDRRSEQELAGAIERAIVGADAGRLSSRSD